MSVPDKAGGELRFSAWNGKDREAGILVVDRQTGKLEVVIRESKRSHLRYGVTRSTTFSEAALKPCRERFRAVSLYRVACRIKDERYC